MSAGDTVEFEIRANVGTDDHGEGDSLTASFTSDNRSAIDTEDEAGDKFQILINQELRLVKTL